MIDYFISGISSPSSTMISCSPKSFISLSPSQFDDQDVACVVTELGKPSTTCMLRFRASRGATYANIEEAVVTGWKKRYHECAEPFIAGFFSLANSSAATLVDLVSAIQRSHLQPVAEKVNNDSSSAIVAIVVVPRLGHPKFKDCRPIARAALETLRGFLDEKSEERKLPRPTVMFGSKDIYVRRAYEQLEEVITRAFGDEKEIEKDKDKEEGKGEMEEKDTHMGLEEEEEKEEDKEKETETEKGKHKDKDKGKKNEKAKEKEKEEKEVEKEKEKAIVITGTSGIGKTIFLWYLLRKFLLESKTVVFDCTGFFLLAHPNGLILSGERGTSFRQYLENDRTIYLCDAIPGCEPLWGGGIAAKTIVTLSPDPSLIDQFVKNARPKMLYMPLWSLKELETCRRLCFPGINATKVENLFAWFGGTARDTIVPVAENAKKKEYLTTLNALTSGEVELNANIIGTSDVVDTKKKTICHRLVHFCPTTDSFDAFTLVPASPRAIDDFTAKNSQAAKATITRLLAGATDSPELAATRGILFERWAHNKLAAGGSFRIRELVHPASESSESLLSELVLKIDASPRTDFSKVAEIPLGAYAVPRAKNFAAVDSIMKPNRLFQMTVSIEHFIIHEVLRKALVVLAGEKKPSEMDFQPYFVVPIDIFNDFKHQSYLTSRKRVYKTPTVKIQHETFLAGSQSVFFIVRESRRSLPRSVSKLQFKTRLAASSRQPRRRSSQHLQPPSSY